ncbi:MAG TPA: type VI secretion system tube protein TssD [Mucilaginibacter sp.]|jgi:type VI secretion system secreted protein Hcp
MKNKYYYQSALLFVLCQFTVLLSFAQVNEPVIGYITIQGTKTGTFKGSGTTKGNEDKIECIGYRYSVSVPHDVATGLPTGKRMHGPFEIIKNVDGSSPQFLQAAYSNEILKSVLVEFFKKNAKGQLYISSKIKLTNASISQISEYGGVAVRDKLLPNTVPQEQITLTFQKIEFENSDAKTSASDDWNIVK